VTAPSDERLRELAAILKQRVGLHVRPEGLSALRLALLARLEDPGPPAADADGYLELLRRPEGDDELRRLLPLVTVGKTAFFRDERQFAALSALFPGLLSAARAGRRRLAIWSAGCATGEEPYSIALTAAGLGTAPEQLELLATDVNPEAVALAREGSFPARRVKGVPAEALERHFDRQGDAYQVRPGLRRYLSAVRPHNLVGGPFPRPGDGGGWDAIFCRNVIIYFDTETTQRVLARFQEVLAPGGYLFLGYSESLFRLFEGLELVEVAGAFLYRRPDAAPRPVRAEADPAGPHPVPMAPPSRAVRHLDPAPGGPPVGPPPPAQGPRSVRPEPEEAGSARRRSEGEARAIPEEAGSARRRSEGEARAIRAGRAGSSPLAPQEFLDAAVALFADGRFGAARELLERLLERGGEDLAARLTLAHLYGVLRQWDRAQASYRAALALEPLSAEAHLFFGIHLFSAQQPEPAAEELSRALFLDPDLALAHYYLGRCREAQRDASRARLAYRNALEAFRRRPGGKRQAFLGYYPDLPEDGGAFVRAAEYALAAL
jgi:chemotaxis protein methyltransferase CheR